MRSVRYLLKNSKTIADFDERKESPWKNRWIPKEDGIHSGDVPVRIAGIVSIPEEIVYMTSLNPNQVTLAVEFDNEMIQNVKATSIELDTSTLGLNEGVANYNSLSVEFTIIVVAPETTE